MLSVFFFQNIKVFTGWIVFHMYFIKIRPLSALLAISVCWQGQASVKFNSQLRPLKLLLQSSPLQMFAKALSTPQVVDLRFSYYMLSQTGIIPNTFSVLWTAKILNTRKLNFSNEILKTVFNQDFNVLIVVMQFSSIPSFFLSLLALVNMFPEVL